jgi:AcrR family transcriptional regulator
MADHVASREGGRGRRGRGRPGLTAEEWADAALTAITEAGPGAVNVEELARVLGVTKGSFYWHYDSRADLIAAALVLWERRDTGGYLSEIEKIPDPADRLRRLIANAVRLSQRRNVYAALSQVDSEPVRTVLQRVAEQRIAFLTDLYAEVGLQDQRAQMLSRLAYATYIGLMRISVEAPTAPLSAEDLEALTAEATRALLPPVQ